MRRGFGELDDTGHLAVTCIDLAMVELERGWPERASRLMLEALPLLDQLDLAPESLTALSVVRAAAEEGRPGAEAVLELRRQMEISFLMPRWPRHARP